MTKTIQLSSPRSGMDFLVSNAIMAIQTATVGDVCYPSLFNTVHGEMFYAIGIVGIAEVISTMQVTETENGFRFVERPMTVLVDGANKEDYVKFILRELAATVANRVLDGTFNVKVLSPDAENCILNLTEAAEIMSNEHNSKSGVL